MLGELKISYNDYTGYVLAMAKTEKDEAHEMNIALKVINTVRTYTADLVAKRIGIKKALKEKGKE